MYPTILVSMLAFFCIWGCTKKQNEAVTENQRISIDKNQLLRVNLGRYEPSFNWQNVKSNTALMLVENIMTALARFKIMSDGRIEVIPALATQWSRDKSGKVWTFQLRPGVQWSDGTPLKAQHFLDGFERLLNPKEALATEFPFLFDLVNGKAFYEGQVTFDKVGVSIGPKGKSLKFQFNKPIGFFHMYMATFIGAPIRKDFIAQYPKSWGQQVNVPVLGPYKPLLLNSNGEVYLERNPYYWSEPAKIAYVKLSNVSDPHTSARLMSQGQFDLNLNPPDVLDEKGKKFLKWKKAYSVISLLINTDRLTFKGAKERRILRQSIDQNSLAKIFGKQSTAQKTWFPPVADLQNRFHFKNNIEPISAKIQEFQKSQRPIKMIAYSDKKKVQLAEAIQFQLKQKLGLNVELKVLPVKLFFDTITKGDYDLAIYAIVTLVPHPYNFMDFFLPEKSKDYTRWTNSEYNQLILKSRESKDLKQANEYFYQIEKILQKEVPLIPLLSRAIIYQQGERIKEWPVGSVRLFHFDKAVFNF